MNREERRKIAKRWHVKPEMVTAFEQMLKEATEAEPMPDGQKVKLNVGKILVNENVLKPAYKDFVREHADDVFTVEKTADNYTHIVTLVEDTTEPKWFWKTTDLIAVEE